MVYDYIAFFGNLFDHAFSEMVLNIMFSIVVVVVVDDLRMMAKPFWLGFSPSQFGMLFRIEVKVSKHFS
jgi:hypothetical protein